jgi:hypothetical protein
MDLFNSPGPDRRILTHLLNGDQELISSDPSIFREGSAGQIPVGSPLYVLCGNQIVMKYWSHNVAINENGNINVKDDAGGASIIAYCEDDTIRYFGAPATTSARQPAVFTLYTTYSNQTGNWTYVGPITPSQTVGIIGTTTNNSANAGSVGELITATIATAGTALTTATPANVIPTPFLSLTAGDWDVWGEVCFLPAATTSVTQMACGISSVSATLPAAGSGLNQSTIAALVVGAIPQCYDVVQRRVSIASTTPYYLTAQAAFTISTLTVFGTIYARRVR